MNNRINPDHAVRNERRALIRKTEQGRFIVRHRECWLGFVITISDSKTVDLNMLRRAVKHHRQHQCVGKVDKEIENVGEVASEILSSTASTDAGAEGG